MADDFQREIRARLANYLDGDETIASVGEWLAGELAQQPAMTPATERVAYDARRYIAEHLRGDLDEAHLEDAVREIVTTTIEDYQPEGFGSWVHGESTSESLVTSASGVGTRSPAGSGSKRFRRRRA